jgi:hypothetical protein
MNPLFTNHSQRFFSRFSGFFLLKKKGKFLPSLFSTLSPTFLTSSSAVSSLYPEELFGDTKIAFGVSYGYDKHLRCFGRNEDESNQYSSLFSLGAFGGCRSGTAFLCPQLCGSITAGSRKILK